MPPNGAIDTTPTTQQQERSILRLAHLLLSTVVVLGLTACRDRTAEATQARIDTPALLRVIARSHGEFVAPPASEADRRRRAEWSRAVARRRPATNPKPVAVAIDSVAGQAADTAPVAGPMRTIRILPDTATLRVGERTVLTLEALDSVGRRTHVPVARWQPDDPGLVILDRTGTVTAAAPGAATIDAWVGTARARARIDVLPVVRGRVSTMDGGVPAGLQVRFVSADYADSTIVAPDGRFEFRPAQTYADTAELWIRPVNPRSTAYHPMVARLTARETGPELNAVVVPTRWTIPSGVYAGVTLDVSADAALRRWRGTAPFARSAAYQGRRTRRVVGWVPDAFPLPVAFVRERSRPSISAVDSAAFWESVRRLEQQLGMTVFRPSDTTALGNGGLGIEVVIDPRIPPAGVTWASWAASGDLNNARVAVRTASDFRNAALIAHEMLHALGFGHALEWRSVMTRTASANVTSLTAQDVAYVQLILRVRAAQAALSADLGFLEAAEGERRTRR